MRTFALYFGAFLTCVCPYIGSPNPMIYSLPNNNRKHILCGPANLIFPAKFYTKFLSWTIFGLTGPIKYGPYLIYYMLSVWFDFHVTIWFLGLGETHLKSFCCILKSKLLPPSLVFIDISRFKYSMLTF